MKNLALFIILTVAVIAAPPVVVKLDTVAVQGKTYTGATIKKRDASHAAIIHADGSATVDIKELPEDVRTQLGYDQKADAQQAKIQAAADADAARAARREQNRKVLEKGCEKISCEVLSIHTSGLVGMHFFVETPTDGVGYLTNRTYGFKAVELGTFTYTTVLGSEKTIPRYRSIPVILDDLDRDGLLLPIR